MANQQYDVIIIGGGVSGAAAALRAAHYHLNTAWICGDQATAKRSRAQWMLNVDNMLSIHDGLYRSKLLNALTSQPEARAAVGAVEGLPPMPIGTRDIIAHTRARIEESFAEQVDIIDAAATSATRRAEQFAIEHDQGQALGRHLVLAMGVMDRQPTIKRQHGETMLDEPSWIYPFANREMVLSCILHEGRLTAGTRVAVIGFSETAAQLAMMLYERYGSACYLLTNGTEPRWSTASQLMLDHYEIGFYQERIVEVLGKRGKLHTLALASGIEVRVSFALVSLGLHRVYNELARALGAQLTNPELPERERLVQINASGETSVPDLFAIGDMARRPDEGVMKQVYTAQEYAVRAIDTVDRRIRYARRASVLANADTMD